MDFCELSDWKSYIWYSNKINNDIESFSIRIKILVEWKDDKIISKVRYSGDSDKFGKIKVDAKTIKSDSRHKEVKTDRNS